MEEKQHILSLSYGKDSMACLGAIERLSWPLDRIVHAEIWATQEVPADLPEMVEFKAYADEIIKNRFGIEVEHIRADSTFEEVFFRKKSAKSKCPGEIYGWPHIRSSWCVGELKQKAIRKTNINGIHYVGIAIDEPIRLSRLNDSQKRSPLAAIGWTEADCLQWCVDNNLLSPIYTKRYRGGCWFCPKQNIDSLRSLRREHPSLYSKMLEWDYASPPEHPFDGRHTLRDYDKRFQMEDAGSVPENKKFVWRMITDTALSAEQK